MVVGLGLARLPTYEKLNVDTPAAIFNRKILNASSTLAWAHILLPMAVIVGFGLLYWAVSISEAAAGYGLAILVTASLVGAPSTRSTDYLLSTAPTDSRSHSIRAECSAGSTVTSALKRVSRWSRIPSIVRTLGGSRILVGTEFWNETVVRSAPFLTSLPNDRAWVPAFDRQTGRLKSAAPTPYVLSYGADVRFRFIGPQVAADRDALVLRPTRPWRADWLTDRIYGDGWTRPHVPARIRVYPAPGQTTPLIRYLTVAVQAPQSGPPKSLTISSRSTHWTGWLNPGRSLTHLRACLRVALGLRRCRGRDPLRYRCLSRSDPRPSDRRNRPASGSPPPLPQRRKRNHHHQKVRRRKHRELTDTLILEQRRHPPSPDLLSAFSGGDEKVAVGCRWLVERSVT